MLIAKHNGFSLIVQTNDHCDPHCHVKTSKWDARFEFSFWRNDVSLWDVRPESASPTAKVVESLRTKLMTPTSLMSARKAWWKTMSSTCLTNKTWDVKNESVVEAKSNGKGLRKITTAVFDPARYTTTLTLDNGDTIEIELA